MTSPFECPHCHGHLNLASPYSTKLEGGIAYAQTCELCHHKVSIRPRLEGDPSFTDREIKELQFVQFRLPIDIERQVHREIANE